MNKKTNERNQGRMKESKGIKKKERKWERKEKG